MTMSALIPDLAKDEPIPHEDGGVVGQPGQAGGGPGVREEDRGVGVVVDPACVVRVLVGHYCSVTNRTRTFLTLAVNFSQLFL